MEPDRSGNFHFGRNPTCGLGASGVHRLTDRGTDHFFGIRGPQTCISLNPEINFSQDYIGFPILRVILGIYIRVRESNNNNNHSPERNDAGGGGGIVRRALRTKLGCAARWPARRTDGQTDGQTDDQHSPNSHKAKGCWIEKLFYVLFKSCFYSNQVTSILILQTFILINT